MPTVRPRRCQSGLSTKAWVVAAWWSMLSSPYSAKWALTRAGSFQKSSTIEGSMKTTRPPAPLSASARAKTIGAKPRYEPMTTTRSGRATLAKP